MENLLEVRAADFVQPGFFESAGDSIEGRHGFYSVALAYQLRTAGVKPEEYAPFVEKLADQLAPAFDDPTVREDVKAVLARASRQWETRCGELAEVLRLSGNVAGSGYALAGLVIYLDRVREQLALLDSFPPPEAGR